MKFLYKLILILIFVNLLSCSKNEKVVKIKELNQEQEMITAYTEAMNNLDDGDAFYAAKKFLEAELLFPQSDWAAKSALMASYSYYLQDYFDEAIMNLERYLKTYPKDKNIGYGKFLLAMCYYETIVDEKKDLQPILIAKDQFENVILEYPNTDFALDARFKVDLINDILASKEMYLGRHYIKKEKWISAINRFKNVLNEFDTTVYTEEAIHRLVEIYYRIGLLDESKKYANLLGYNYLSSEWYKKSYKVFNKNYNNYTIKKDQKKKKGIVKKFKKLFE
jgi:outer membrane protein assembly factor BamD